jgi:hypothetical protein
MRFHRILLVTGLTLATASSLSAQQKPSPPTVSIPGTPPVAAGPSPIDPNVRLEISIVEQSPEQPSQPKTVMLLLSHGAQSHIRAAFQDEDLNLDARPQIVDGRIRTQITVATAKRIATAHNWSHFVSLWLDSGKPVVAVETNDVANKRKVTIEVKATILK